jgi:mRNA-degrading endonuclease RelE of RelBE toxin-antitoxin system
MLFSEWDEFNKEFKKLKKKYLSLGEDLEIFKEVIKKFPKGSHSKNWNILKEDNGFFILKARMMCRYIRKSSFRVIYLYNANNKTIIFVELYFKGDKLNENKNRIEEVFNYFKK